MICNESPLAAATITAAFVPSTATYLAAPAIVRPNVFLTTGALGTLTSMTQNIQLES